LGELLDHEQNCRFYDQRLYLPQFCGFCTEFQARVVAWAAPLPQYELSLSAITILELEAGILRMEQRDAARGALLKSWFETRVLPSFEGRLLPVDTAVARCCAQLHVPDPRSELDALIAATALIHNLTVVTRNEADFVRTGVRLINPWR
jgi:hypothetical protein